MHIAFLAKRSAIHTVRWVNEMARRGHDVSLISMHRGGDAVDDRVKRIYLPFGPPLGYFLNAFHIKGILRDIRPDFMHVHYASGYGTLGRLSGFHPLMLSVWGSDVYDFPVKSPLHARVLRDNIRSADMVCSTSHVMAKQTRDVCPGGDEIEITPFGIDTDVFRPAEGRRDNATVTVGTVKTMAYKYGIDVLLKAFASARREVEGSDVELARRMKLLIVGGGPQMTDLVRLSRSLSIADVTEFSGAISHDEVPRYLNLMHIYVAPSRLDSESFGVAILEASACGLPVIVSDAGGLPEVVVDGETGLIAPKEDVEATAHHIVSLVRDRDLRMRLGAKGRKHVSDNYSWVRSADIMERAYEKLLGRAK